MNINSVLSKGAYSVPLKLENYQSTKLPNLRVELLDRQITLMTERAILEAIQTVCNNRQKITIASYNIHSFNLSMQIPWFYEFQQSADIARCDGLGILKALSCLGLNLPIQYRVSGTNFVPKLLDFCHQNGLAIFLLGSKPHYLEKALELSRKKYPYLRISGHHGYFDKEDKSHNQRVIDDINQQQPNILLVGMGMPVQERWILQNRSQVDVNVFMPCGAVIDRLAGVVSNCPRWLGDRGWEWLHRLVSNPKHLASRYLLGNPAFLLHIALAKSSGFSTLRVTEI
jgi:N-acetylglucosaminyldiphosphoundecaprenol N-acetyl-beta-D-mannosaminyltransferase